MPEVKKEKAESSQLNNLDLWNRVEKTDPTHTKKVEFGRKFTAIDAMYQIKMATEQFGEAGTGWGWSFSEPLFPTGGTVVIKCTLWHSSKGDTVEHFGQAFLEDSKGKPDKDAFKKAGTDGLTKCLSYLGFNADVFLGKFDDNKYVQEMRETFKPDGAIIDGALDSGVRKDADAMFVLQLNEGLDTVGSLEDLNAIFTAKAIKSLQGMSGEPVDKLRKRYSNIMSIFRKKKEDDEIDFNN